MKNDIPDTIRDFVVETFLFGEKNGLKDTSSFLDGGFLDSTGILELVAFIEDRFAIRMLDNEIIPENLDSIANATAYVCRKLAAKAIQS